MATEIISKICSKCKQTKPLNEFYKRLGSKYDVRADCKICFGKQIKEYGKTPNGKAARKKAIRKYMKTEKGKQSNIRKVKKYLKTAKGKAMIKRYNQRYIAKHRTKFQARWVINNAIRDGKLPHPSKLKCHYGNHQATVYHHWHGYEPEHWLDVVPACNKCHKKQYPKHPFVKTG